MPAEGWTLQEFPGPTPAFFVAIATFLALGGLLGYIGGWSHGAPPTAHPNSTLQRAYRFNATNRPRSEDVVFHGNSLMEMGLISDDVASTLKIDPRNVQNLAVLGAGIWEVEWVVERCEPPLTDGPKVAVVGIDRAWFNLDQSPITPYARCKIGEDRQATRAVGDLQRLFDQSGYLMPARREARAWMIQFTYDWLGYQHPRWVRLPDGPSVKVWDFDPVDRKRSVAMVDTRSRQGLKNGEFAEHAVSALRLMIRQLKQRSYQVVLFLPPLRREVLESIETSPDAVVRERKLRSLITAPPYLGADHFVEFRNSQVLGAVDDVIFIDYGHLTREGAERQSRKLAEVLSQLGLLDKKPSRREAAITHQPVSSR